MVRFSRQLCCGDRFNDVSREMMFIFPSHLNHYAFLLPPIVIAVHAVHAVLRDIVINKLKAWRHGVPICHPM
jgi:hypothetical protein